MWLVFFGALFLLAAAGAVYIVARLHRLGFIRRLAGRHRALSWLACVAMLASLGLFALINVWTVIIVFLHLAVAWALCDLAAFIIRKASRRNIRYDAVAAAAIILCGSYLGVGWYNAHHVSVAEYTVETEKAIGELRVALIADCHIGITLDGEDFAREMERVGALAPDAVFIVGDFVDDDSKKDDMLRACRALGELKTKYGVYFVFGNHDDGYMRYRDFDSQALRAALAENGVTILEDESALVDGRFYVVGRKDRSARDRSAAQELTADLDSSKYAIMLDHQPNDYEAEAASGADLVLSGHTHGGHVFPAGLVGLALGSNDRVYGTETRGATTFVVTSGISGWAIPFKTGTRSEVVIVNVVGK